VGDRSVSRSVGQSVSQSVSQLWKLKYKPIPVAVLSKAWVCGRSLAGIAGSNPAGVMDVRL